MTTALFAYVNLIVLITAVSKYASTLRFATSALHIQNEKEADLLAAVPMIPREQQQRIPSPSAAGHTPIFCPKCRYKYSSKSCKKRAKYLAKEYANGNMDEAIQQIYREHPDHCRQKRINLSPNDICFVTAEFADTADDMDRLPIPDEAMRTDPPRHFAFTNQPRLHAPAGWTKIVLDESKLTYKRQITKSRWPKFMGWQHPTLQHCQVIFYGDAYLMNPINETNWLEMARDIKLNPVGLMQDKQIGLTGSNKPIKELIKVASEGKLSTELAEKTIGWLQSREDYKEDATVYKNAIFGYDPHNVKVQHLMNSFWDIYAKEELSWRDQPIWAYLLAREDMVPLPLHRKGGRIFGEFGQKGHGGHVYVQTAKVDDKLRKKRKKKKERRVQVHDVVSSHGSKTDYEICFITSVFADTIEDADKVQSVVHLREANPNFQYYVFTNLDGLEAPGWEKIVKANLPYKRMITQSRLGKFVPWKEDRIRQGCGVIFYSDGHMVPKAGASEVFRREAKRVKESKYGLAQWQHKTLTNYKKLAWSIAHYGKDKKKNIQRTMEQLSNFYDFREKKTTIYWNQVLAFDPNNEYYVGASERFWELYSKEYGSWRDQLIWSYVLDSSHMKPLELKPRELLYDENDTARGFDGHVYVQKRKMKKKKRKKKATKVG